MILALKVMSYLPLMVAALAIGFAIAGLGGAAIGVMLVNFLLYPALVTGRVRWWRKASP